METGFLQSIFLGSKVPKNISQKKATQIQNNREYMNQFYHLFNLTMAIFRWDGLPDTCNARALEMSLITRGQAILAKPKDLHYLNLGSTTTGYWNVYGEPTQAFGYGYNGYNALFDLYVKGQEINTPEKWIQNDVEINTTLSYPSGHSDVKGVAVWCRDNAHTYPYLNYLMSAAIRMTDAIRTADVAAKNLKSPVIITCEESQITSVQEALKQRDDNLPIILGTGKLGLDQTKVWDVKASPDNLKACWEHYERIENHYAKQIGIQTANQTDKQERLLVDEVNAANSITEFNLEKRLHYRKDFCEMCNDFFGLNMSVELKEKEAAMAQAALDGAVAGEVQRNVD